MSLEFHVKCRDAYQQLADAHNEEIESRTPLEVKYDAKHFDTLKWVSKTGAKGTYEQTTKEANNNSEVFQALQKILNEKGGFWQNSNHKYWQHQGNPSIIDRRRKNESSNPHRRMDNTLHNIREAGERLTKGS